METRRLNLGNLENAECFMDDPNLTEEENMKRAFEMLREFNSGLSALPNAQTEGRGQGPLIK